MVTENILLREVLWMLMGVSKLYLFKFNGKFFVPKPDIAVAHLSQVRFSPKKLVKIKVLD